LHGALFLARIVSASRLTTPTQVVRYKQKHTPRSAGCKVLELAKGVGTAINTCTKYKYQARNKQSSYIKSHTWQETAPNNTQIDTTLSQSDGHAKLLSPAKSV
jgi:hypothetical protein